MLSSTTMSTSFRNGSIMACPPAVDKSGMGQGCKSGVMSAMFFNVCGGMDMPLTRAERRFCMEVAGISPSTYSVRLGIGARQLNTAPPEATATAMLNAANVLPMPRGAYRMPMPCTGRTGDKRYPRSGMDMERNSPMSRAIRPCCLVSAVSSCERTASMPSIW